MFFVQQTVLIVLFSILPKNKQQRNNGFEE